MASVVGIAVHSDALVIVATTVLALLAIFGVLDARDARIMRRLDDLNQGHRDDLLREIHTRQIELSKRVERLERKAE